MNICFLAHNVKRNNGGGRFVATLAEGMQKLLHADITVLTTEGGSGDSYEMPILAVNKGKLFLNIFSIRRILKRCDVIHACDVYPFGILAVLLSWGLGKKIIITAVGSGSIIPLYSLIWRSLAVWSYRKAHVVVAISNYTKQEILKRVPGLHIQVINPGVDLHDAAHVTEKAIPAHITSLKPYILSVGALRWRKGYKLSIRAFAETLTHIPDLRYVIVGNGTSDIYMDRLHTIIDELHLEGKVIIIENVKSREELFQWYRGAELFCLLSQNIGHDVEGFGMVFLEAASSGLPVVGSQESGIEDAMREGKNGFLVNPRDPHAMAQAIIRILQDTKLKEKMSQESLKFARVSTWDARLAEYAALYRSL